MQQIKILNMANKYFERYVWLLNVINDHGPITFKEISNRWAHSQANTLGESYLPERTFHNHREAIQETFGIEIKCDRSLGYYIADSDELKGEGVRQWLLASLSLNNLLNESRDMRDRILFEKIPSRQRWLSVIVNAMRAGKVIEMTYQSFWRDEPNTYKAKPYCLKLFKQRWYMLASSDGIDDLWIYALDERMINVVQTEEDYSIPEKFDAEEFFSNYFGVIIGTDWEPQEVKIKVVNSQVRYFDTLPLHISQQKVEEESDEEYTIYKYHLAPTHDFKKEIMSWGPDVEVLSPEDFRQEIKDAVAYMSEQYSR